MKIFVGNAKDLANIGIIFAKLIIKEKDHGIHLFIVPLRDKITHETV